MSTTNILSETNNGILTVTINREGKLNALNLDVLTELQTLLKTVGRNPGEVKGVILTGSGEKAFIAGADIAQMSSMTKEEARDFGALGQEVTLLLENLPVPVIACVNGFALGGGCEMAMSCDFIYATKTAVFGQPEVKLGLIPGFGGTQRLARLIGRNAAREIIYTGRNMKVDEAFERGLVVKVFEDKAAMIAAATETLKLTQGNSPLAIRLSKKTLNAGVDLTVEQGLALELDQFAAVFGSEDMREGTAAFVEKRAPKFTGK
jgi:enoyl-CoA hydratase